MRSPYDFTTFKDDELIGYMGNLRYRIEHHRSTIKDIEKELELCVQELLTRDCQHNCKPTLILIVNSD